MLFVGMTSFFPLILQNLPAIGFLQPFNFTLFVFLKYMIPGTSVLVKLQFSYSVFTRMGSIYCFYCFVILPVLILISKAKIYHIFFSWKFHFRKMFSLVIIVLKHMAFEGPIGGLYCMFSYNIGTFLPNVFLFDIIVTAVFS